MPVRACPDHSYKGFCNKHYSEMPSSCNYCLSFLMLIRNLILGSSGVGDCHEKSCHMNVSRSPTILSWTFVMRLVRDVMIPTWRGKNSKIFMLEWYWSPHKSQKKKSPQSFRNTLYLYNLFVFNLCYIRTARTSGTAHNIREISGSFSYVPDFITMYTYTPTRCRNSCN